ncbi:PREDICTED: mucin-13 [Condylura cristata]|uniref:mucin-13 n=1 Tax=Condylura cristata TaxID=143302 RepID=UPI0006438106|nr:PREDICTED: mucin-13 [Condylura cristata]
MCPVGYFYNETKCDKGSLFPGKIQVKVNETSGLEDEHSPAYQQLHKRVTDFFKETFKDKAYGQTIILKISLSPSARSEMRAVESNVEVTVANIFQENSITEEDVKKTIQNALTNSKEFGNYDQQNTCEYYGCEVEKNGCGNGLQCKCKPGLYRPISVIPLCVAQCADNCTAEKHKQCLWKSFNESATCVCLPGYKEDNGVCHECSFGYSGVSCEDNFLLILTIVGSIAGALIVCMTISLIFVARSKNKKKNTEEQKLIENDFTSMRMQQTGISNRGADTNIFPKARTTASKFGQPQNPYGHSRHMPNPDY